MGADTPQAYGMEAAKEPYLCDLHSSIRAYVWDTDSYLIGKNSLVTVTSTSMMVNPTENAVIRVTK